MNSPAIEKAFSLTPITNKAMSTLEDKAKEYLKESGTTETFNELRLRGCVQGLMAGFAEKERESYTSQQVKEALERAAETVIKELDFAGYAEGEQSLEEFSESAKESILSLIKEY